MGHTYISNLVHHVFSTKHRQKLITPQLEVRLWPYMGGIARENGMKAISIGGTEDHILYPRSSTPIFYQIACSAHAHPSV